MFTSYLHRKVAAMERAFSYDAAYVHEMLDASTSAFIKFAMFQRMAAHCDSVSREAWYAAKLAAVIAEDCDPAPSSPSIWRCKPALIPKSSPL
jgi:hypothetical protein